MFDLLLEIAKRNEEICVNDEWENGLSRRI